MNAPKFKLELFNNWSRRVAHVVYYTTEEEAIAAAKRWEGSELWSVEVVPVPTLESGTEGLVEDVA